MINSKHRKPQMKTTIHSVTLLMLSAFAVSSASAQDSEPKAGFPASDEAQKAYENADLARAIQVYKFFYPTVTGAAIIKGNESIGLVTNKVFGIMDSNPKQVGSSLI